MFGFLKKKEFLNAQIKAFPKECREDVIFVCRQLSYRNLCNSSLYCRDFFIQDGKDYDWQTSNGEQIQIPSRIYITDQPDSVQSGFSERQKMIYHCMFSRSCDGYIREEHIRWLLSSVLPEWAKIYIIKICGEYVVEILQAVYGFLSKVDCTEYKQVCALNLKNMQSGHSRMISYWNEFYRYDCYRYQDYIGKKLYAECFGYRKTGQKRIIIE